nr:class I adenylate-forming enzyme family protein [Kibdelosporangium sp. MJ126-NF4]CEL13402.1 Long-chain-fatty-acid--CoA ligase [Kibdelosporangium sp. MJ126-NF4]CTQ99091.1 Long-chain-fatty-acid--CoA ligase (EC 6.2.1.3) [Kibdelosporangium sp. MJ126-NF4]
MAYRAGLRADFDIVHTWQGIPFGEARRPCRSIGEYISHRSTTQGDAPYLTFPAEGQEQVLTYRELDCRTRGIGRWVRHELGLADRETVAVLPVNDMASVLVVLALVRTGHPVLVLNPNDPVDRLRTQLSARQITHVLRPPSVSGTVWPAAEVAGELGGSDDLPTHISPYDDALFFGTSGSTAASKVVAQSHGNLAANADAVRRHHRLRTGDTMLGCLPIHHVNGMHFTVIATLVSGAHAVLAPGFDPFAYPTWMARFRPRIASVVPTILDSLTEVWRTGAPHEEFDYFVSAAAPLDASVAETVHRKFGTRIMQGYGLTETTNFSATMPPDISERAYQELMIDTDIPSIGIAMPGNDMTLLDPEGKPVAHGQIGEICVRGHNVMTRYAGNVVATDEAFRGHWFHTGDLGRTVVNDTGQVFYVITGRNKNIAKVAGAAVSLDEMDRALKAVPGVRDAAAVCIPTRFVGDEIVAVVVSTDDSLDIAGVRASLCTTFADTALPRRVVRLDALPRTPTGKILRPQLAELITSKG